MKDNVIAIDGFSYVGKSTIAQTLSKITGYTYINTGQMYRATACLILENKLAGTDKKKLADFTKTLTFEFKEKEIWVNSRNLSREIDQDETIRFTPTIAAIPEIRQILTDAQRLYASQKIILMEGRDIGTVVFPNARWKFFITASFEVRAKRMYKRLSPEDKTKIKITDKTFLDKLRHLDDTDLNRPIAPLKKAQDAVEYDNSEAPTEVEDAWMLHYCMKFSEKIKDQKISYSPEIVEESRQGCLRKVLS